MKNKYNLTISCPDQQGIVAAVSGFIAEHNGLILEADHHTDLETNWFFMRYEIDADTLGLSVASFQESFSLISDRFGMKFQIRRSDNKQRVLILVSRESHCLEDLLFRWHSQEVNCSVVGVASNHQLLRDRTQWYDLPFFHLPIEANNKQQHFEKISALAKQLEVDLIVLARYMQIIPAEICEAFAGRMINIHHSFLPSFVGAKPYAQAYHRGVKLIGATSHYVTDDLDQGPIIEQDVVRISHRQNLKDYIRMGKDVERSVLSRALKAHLEDRVIIHGRKTIVFN